MILRDYLNDIIAITGYTEEQLRTEKRDLMLLLYEFTKLNRADQLAYLCWCMDRVKEIQRNEGI